MRGLRTLFILCPVVLGLLSTPVASPSALPDELQHLETLAEDEAALVSAARRFHRTHIRLIEWDRSLASRYAQGEHDDLADTKAMDVQTRLRLIRTMWEFVVGHYPRNAEANNYYGEYLYDFGGDALRAVQLWRLAAQTNPKYAHPFNNLGLHYFHTGQIKRGLQHFETALDLEPDNPDFLFNLSQMYMLNFPQLEIELNTTKTKLYKEAMEMSRKATESAPDDFVLAQDYATNFYAAEQYGADAEWLKAAQAWQRATPLARTEDEYFYCLLNEGRTWLRTNQGKNALGPLERALELRPDSTVAADLVKKARSVSRS